MRRVLRSAAGLGIALLAVPVAVTLAVFGCGNDGGDTTAASTAGSEEHVVRSAGVAAAPATAVTATQVAGPDPAGVGLVSANEAPSPDVTASVQDSTVQPGHAIDVMAIATDDVRQVVLWDGIHDRQAFAFDSTAGVWRASYRMPLKAERVGLSVTAFNTRDRWRRVWVFVNAPKPGAIEVPATEEHH
jgi:hypothetical protein